MEKRPYETPAITGDDKLEQTSLACNVTSLPQRGPDCASQFRKSPAFFDDSVLNCSQVLIQDTCMEVLS